MPGTDLFFQYAEDAEKKVREREAQDRLKSEIINDDRARRMKAGGPTEEPPPPAPTDAPEGLRGYPYREAPTSVLGDALVAADPSSAEPVEGPLKFDELGASHVLSKDTLGNTILKGVKQTGGEVLRGVGGQIRNAAENLGVDASIGAVYGAVDKLGLENPGLTAYMETMKGLKSAIGLDAPVDAVASAGSDIAKKGEEIVKANLSAAGTNYFQQRLQSSISSVGLSISALGIAFLSKNPMLGLSLMGAISGGQQYQDSREFGDSASWSQVTGGLNSTAEILGEKLGFEKLLSMGEDAAKKEIKKAIFTGLQAWGLDVGGELLTTVAQDLISKMSNRPNLTLKELQSDLKDTFWSTLFMGPMQTAIVGGMGGAARLGTKSDFGPTNLKENIEQNFEGSKVDLTRSSMTGETITGANITMPNGRVVEVHTSDSPMAPDLKKAVDEGAKKKGIDTATTAISGAYFKSGLLVGTENDLIFLTGQMTDATTLPHEKGHLIIEIMRDTMTPEELAAIGIPATGPIGGDLEEGVVTTFEEYVYKRTPSITNPMSPLDKAYQGVVDFAHEIYSAFGGATTQRQVFEEMRTGKILQREGATRQAGESDAAFQVRTIRPAWHMDDVKTQSGVIVGAPGSHLSPQAREGLIRRMLNVTTQMYKVNPEQTKWYALAGEDVRRVFGLKRKTGKVEPGEDLWEGDVQGADNFLRAVAQWSIQADVERNTGDAIEVMRRILKGDPAEVAGVMTGAATMAARFVKTMQASEVTKDLAGFGEKATSFYWDLHNATFEVRDENNATIDRHIIGGWDLASRTGRPMEGLKGPQYRWGNNVMKEITKRFNAANGTDLTPSEVQPLVWAWQRGGRNFEKQDVEHIGTHIGKEIVTGEIIPAVDSDLTPWIHTENYAMKKAYSQHIAKAVLYDENGNDRILAMMGLSHLQTPGDTGGFGLGTWDGAINPNVIAKMHLAGMSEKDIRLYADLFGYIFTQNAVGWYQPDSYHTNREGSLQGWKILREDGGQITDSLAASYYEILKSKVPKANITFTGDEIHVVNYMGMDVKELQKAITEVGREWKEKHGIEGAGDTQFGVIGDLQSGDEEGSAGWTGGLYKSRLREAGRPDLLEGADRERASAIAAARDFSEQVAPPGAKFQAKDRVASRTTFIFDIDGKDRTNDVRATAYSEAVSISQLLPKDRVWLMPTGKAVFLEEWELHENRAYSIVSRANVINKGRLTNHMFGGSIGAVRVHGINLTMFVPGQHDQLAIELFSPMTPEVKALLSKSLGVRKSILADVTDPETGVVLGYAYGKGAEGLAALEKAAKKAYKPGAKLQAKPMVETKDGEFPMDHNGWKFEGQWPGMDFYQYTSKDPKSPSFGTTIVVSKPEDLAAKIAASDKKFSEGKGPKFQTKEFKRWFGDSKVVDAEGNPMPLFHGTDKDFSSFRLSKHDIGIHLGTSGQANDRMDYLLSREGRAGRSETGSRLIPVYAKIENPFRMKDMGLWNLDNMHWYIRDAFPNDWMAENLHTIQDIRHLLQARGYDGIVYENTGEVEGAHPLQVEQDAAMKALAESQKRRGKSYNSYDAEDRKTPEYVAFNAAYKKQSEYRANNAKDSWIVFDRKQIKSVFNESPKASDPRFQTRTPGPKGLTVNFTSPEVTALGEELLRGAFEKLQFTQTNDATMKLAQELIDSGKMSLDVFMNHDPYTAWPDTAHKVAAEAIAGGVFDYVKNQIAEYKAGRITADEANKSRMIAMASIASWYLPQSEVGRMLQARQMAISPEGIPIKDLMDEQMKFETDLQELKNRGLIDDEQILDAMDQFYSIDQAQNFARRVAAKKVRDISILNQLFYFSLLSNPVTQSANLIGNLGPVFFAIAEQYLSEKIPYGATPKGGAEGMAAGLYHGLLDAFVLAKRAAQTGESAFGGGKFRSDVSTGIPTVDQSRAALAEIMADKTHPFHDPSSPEYGAAKRDVARLHRQGSNAITGERFSRLTSGAIDANGSMARVIDLLGTITDSPFKGLAAGDEFFKAIAYRMSIYKAAYQLAATQGLEGDAFNTSVATFVDNPTPSADAEATAFAAKQTFTNEMGEVGQFLQKMSNKEGVGPIVKFFIPFVKITTNIGLYNVERVPILNLVLKQVRDDMAAGGTKRDAAIAKTVSGGAVMLVFAGLAMAGMVTGGGPADPKLKQLWSQPDADGNVAWQEYSLKINGKWVSYKRLEPFATMIGIAADMVEVSRAFDVDVGEMFLVGALAGVRNMTSKTWMIGVSQLIDTLTSGGAEDLGRNAKKLGRQLPSLLIPGGLAQAARVVDPTKRDVQSWMDVIKSRIPGLSSDLEPKYTLKGDPITVQMYESMPGKGFGMINPILYTGNTKDPVSLELVRNRIPISMPSRRLGGGINPEASNIEGKETGVDLTPEQYGWFVKMAGNDLKDPKTGLGAWDELTAIINGDIPADYNYQKGKKPEALYYNQKNPDGSPVFSDGPEGGKAFIITSVLLDARNEVRKMIQSGEVFPDLGVQYEEKKMRKEIRQAPQVGGAR